MVQFLLKLLLKKIFCCVPRFPLILTAQFHFIYVKESEILERRSQIFYLRFRNPAILPPIPQPYWQAHSDCFAAWAFAFFTCALQSDLALIVISRCQFILTRQCCLTASYSPRYVLLKVYTPAEPPMCVFIGCLFVSIFISYWQNGLFQIGFLIKLVFFIQTSVLRQKS